MKIQAINAFIATFYPGAQRPHDIKKIEYHGGIVRLPKKDTVIVSGGNCIILSSTEETVTVQKKIPVSKISNIEFYPLPEYYYDSEDD